MSAFLHKPFGGWPLLRAFGNLLLLIISATASAQQVSPGAVKLIEADGIVEVKRVNSAVWDKASTEANYNILHPGDELRTGNRSRAAVMLSDKSVVRVGEGGRIQVLEKPKKKSGFSLFQGIFYFFHRDNPDAVELNTPTVSAVVRGTEFNVKVSEQDGTTLISLVDGLVAMENAFGRADLKSGDEGVAEPGKKPEIRPMIEAVNIIQWTLYYPGVVNVDDLQLSVAEQQPVEASLKAYRAGNLIEAMRSYPAGRQPASNAEKLYLAALLLSVGQVEQAQALTGGLDAQAQNTNAGAVAEAIRKVIAAVKNEPLDAKVSRGLSSEWLAQSYLSQSRSDLEGALKAAYRAADVAPNFGFAWERVAELEFSFGHIGEAMKALDKSLSYAPENAQALALKGFLLTAQNRIRDAVVFFDRAIALDGSLANARLGKGLCRIRQGDIEGGRQDLEIAAALEPKRASLRSYLGKAYNQAWDDRRAEHELTRAKQLDPHDPTAWLYSALIKQQESRINEAVDDFEHSQELNNNRSVYRSRLLLDQDRAVRGANLATIYQDANMNDVSVREAVRAVNDDYANYSAHLFLAGSYNALRDPHLVNLRYETPWLNEYLVANLLSDVRAGTLSPQVTQQEYSKLFERDRFGFSSSTEYYSRGDWLQNAVQYGIFGNSSYAAELTYGSFNGHRPNNDLEFLTANIRAKQQLTPHDSIYFQAIHSDSESGDLTQYYYDQSPQRTGRVHDSQKPMLLAGYHHEWSPGIDTLFLGGHLKDTLRLTDNYLGATILLYRGTNFGAPIEFVSRNLVFPNGGASVNPWNYESDFDLWTAELQQLFKVNSPELGSHTLVLGSRFQNGTFDTQSELNPGFGQIGSAAVGTGFQPALNYNTNYINQHISEDIQRITFYGYETWQIVEPLLVTVGVSYDRLYFPSNFRAPPISAGQETDDQLSPKAGIIWTPVDGTTFRAAYTRSLGGVSFDQSFQIEPSQVGGFNQAFRSLIPESVALSAASAHNETWGVAWDQKFPTRTYLGAQAELLTSEADRQVGSQDVIQDPPQLLMDTNGVITFNPGAIRFAPTSTHEHLKYYERNLALTLNQLISDEWSVGARYRLSDANLKRDYPEIPKSIAPLAKHDESATLHQVDLFALFNHPSGFFGQFDALWSQQSNRGYAPDIPGDDFWQFNIYAGYRTPRRFAEFRVGILNLTDRNYQLNPLNLTADLPRDRTFYTSLKISF